MSQASGVIYSFLIWGNVSLEMRKSQIGQDIYHDAPRYFLHHEPRDQDRFCIFRQGAAKHETKSTPKPAFCVTLRTISATTSGVRRSIRCLKHHGFGRRELDGSRVGIYSIWWSKVERKTGKCCVLQPVRNKLDRLSSHCAVATFLEQGGRHYEEKVHGN